MKVLVAGGAGFIGSNYVRTGSRAPRRRGARARQAHLRRAAREPRGAAVGPSRAGRGRHRRPRRRPRRDRGLRRGGQLRRRVPRRPLDRVAGRVHHHRRVRHLRAAGGRARRGRPPPAGLDRRGLRLDLEEGSFTEGSPLDPSSPYSASKAGGDLLVGAFARTYGAEALIVRASNNYGPRQHPEKLIPLCILNALAGDPLPVYGDGIQVRNWLYVEDFAARRSTRCSSAASRARSTTSAAPTSCANIEVVERILELTGPRRVADRVRHRPPGPRPPLLAGLGEGRRSSAGRRRRLRRGPRAHRRLVSRERVVVGADPLGRVPRVLRAPLRRGCSAARG